MEQHNQEVVQEEHHEVQRPQHVQDLAHDPSAFLPFHGHIPAGATASAFALIHAKDPTKMREKLKHDEKNVKIHGIIALKVLESIGSLAVPLSHYIRQLTLSPGEIMADSELHDHCLNCFRSVCNSKCPIIRCEFCSVSLHSCKRDDHLEICQNVVVPCINSIYGCRRSFKRSFLKLHLATCAASVVVCHMQWNRSALSELAKKQIKKLAKGFSTDLALTTSAEELDDTDIDVVGCVLDQKKIIDYFQLKREYRTSFRDYFSPEYPVLPLLAHKNRPNDDIESFHDRSDDEKWAEAEKIRKKMLPWANCYICKIDPATQHLHVLGNLQADKNDKSENGPQVKDALFIPEFYRRKGLMLTNTFNRVPSTIKKGGTIFEVRKGRPFFTFQCPEVVRRTEVEDHVRFHAFEDNDWHMHRCPLWLEGCEFVASNMSSNQGRFRYCSFLKKVVHEPMPSANSPNENFDKDIFYRVLPLLSEFVDSATLRTLSVTSKWTRAVLESARQVIVTVRWKRTEDFYGNVFWEEQQPQYSFTKCQRLPTVTPRVSQAFREHFAECEYRKREEPELEDKLKTFLLLVPTRERIY